MSTAPVSRFHTSRSRACVALACSGLLVVLGVMMVAAGVAVCFGKQQDAAGIAAFLGLLAVVIGGVGIWLTRHALAMFRMQATLSNRGLACVTQTWGVWRGRKIVERDLTWNQIQGVRVISYPNPYADGGVEHNFVVHTDQETLNFSTMMWPEAATIVDTILANIGKQLDELPEEAKAADVPKGVGSRVADVCMRGLGWLAIGMGALSTIGMVALVFSKEAKDWGAIGTLSVVTGTLFTAGRALTRWRSSGIQATRDATAAS